MGDPRISDFMALLEVAKTSSFSSAAKNLRTSPVNLLNRINKLEAYFQVEIFTRTNRGVFLTREGERVLEVSRAIVGLLAVPQPASPVMKKGLVVKLGASHIPGQYVLPCLISNYQLSNPSIRFDLRIMENEALFSQLEEGYLDLACYVGKGSRRSPSEVEVARDRLVVIAPVKHELTRRESSLLDVLRKPLILYEEGKESAGLVEDYLDQNGAEPEGLDIRMRLPEPEGVITAVSQGLGLGFCPEIIARKSERAGLISIVRIRDSTDESYPIIARKGGVAHAGVKGFWLYLSNVSRRFKGNLPCMLKMLYL